MNEENHANDETINPQLVASLQEEKKDHEDLELKTTKSFSHWVKFNKHENSRTTNRVSSLIKLYWGIAEKHERHLKKKEVLPLNESEKDRQMISDAYKSIQSPQELEFDRRTYQALVRMQELRDQSYLLEELDDQYKMELIAWELKIRQHPIFILPHVTSSSAVTDNVLDEFQISGIISNQASSENEGQDQPEWEIQSPVVVLDSRQVARPVSRIDVDNTKQELISTRLVAFLKSKTLSLEELSQKLTTLELQLLSTLLSKKELLAIFNPQKRVLTFINPTDADQHVLETITRKCTIALEARKKERDDHPENEE